MAAVGVVSSGGLMYLFEGGITGFDGGLDGDDEIKGK